MGGKWGRKECAKFTGVVLSDSSVDMDDSRVKNLFDKYDTENTGFLRVEHLKSFYLEASITRERVVRDNILNLGFRPDLTKLSAEVSDDFSQEDQASFTILKH